MLISNNFYEQFTCNNEHVSSVYSCINNGTFCSDHGTCDLTGICKCDAGWEGQQCQSLASTSNSDLGTRRFPFRAKTNGKR
jgi:hypothetical protein